MTVFECGVCGKELRRSKGPETKWEWHYFTMDGKHQRHFKKYCNLATPEQLAAFKKKRVGTT